ncbi:MAG: hypothetical protein R2864_11255 [Syntrophotaleaceae bacterium]
MPQQPETSPQTRPAEAISLDNPELYLNRELGWLQFNQRVLLQAEDPRIPLLERVKFLAIAGSNLDEFFMKRIGGLKQQALAGVHRRTIDGLTPEEQIAACYAFIEGHQRDKHRIVLQLTEELAKEGILFPAYNSLSETEQQALRTDFYDNIYPLVTPQSIDPAHPFPFVSNLSLNLLVTLRYPGSGELSWPGSRCRWAVALPASCG